MVKEQSFKPNSTKPPQRKLDAISPALAAFAKLLPCLTIQKGSKRGANATNMGA